MQISNSLQQSWYIISSIMENYILNTATPLLFKDLFDNYKVFRNAECKDVFLREKESWEAEKNNPNNRRNVSPKFYNLIKEVWEILLKKGLVDVFIHRLLGSQADMDSYLLRSQQYVTTFNEIVGTDDLYNDMSVITQKFLTMLKDYLCRNISELQACDEQLSIAELLKTTRKAYLLRRYENNTETYVERNFYIPFEERSYAAGLIRQMDEIAINENLPNKCEYFLVAAEYIHTLFIYVYMVEYIKQYPIKKGDKFKPFTPEIKQGIAYNLFTHLKKVNFEAIYEEEKVRLDERNRNN